jgi:hypothetical protein
VFQRSVNRLAGSKAIRDGEEIRLEDRLEDGLECCLNDPVLHSGNPQAAKLPGCADLRDEDSSHRRWPVCARAQLHAQCCNECLGPLRHVPHRDAVHACRSSAAVTRDAREGHSQVAGVGDQPPQLAKDVVDLLLTSRVQLSLLDPEPVPVGSGRHIHGFPRRPRSHTHHCLPSPCTRLSRARTTTEAPPLIRDVARPVGSPDFACPALGSRFPCSKDEPLVR